MTDEMMTLRSLLEKSSDADLLREMIGFTAQGLIELEVEGLIGAAMASAALSGLATDARRARWGCASPSSGKAATSRPSWNRARREGLGRGGARGGGDRKKMKVGKNPAPRRSTYAIIEQNI
jgi:hypothetical protein